MMTKYKKNRDTKVVGPYLISTNQLITEGKPWHDSSLLQPEDGSKASTEEDTLHCSKGHYSLSKVSFLVTDPLNGPVCLLFDTWQGLNGIEEVISTIIVK